MHILVIYFSQCVLDNVTQISDILVIEQNAFFILDCKWLENLFEYQNSTYLSDIAQYSKDCGQLK